MYANIARSAIALLLLFMISINMMASAITAAPLPRPRAAPQEPSSSTSSADVDASSRRQPPLSIVHFTVDPKDQGHFTTQIYSSGRPSESVRAGEQFGVVYNAARAKCEHVFDNKGVDTWTVYVGFQSTTGQTHQKWAEVAYVDPLSNSTVTPTVTIPPMSTPGKAKFWFVCTNLADEAVYDSNFGDNWTVDVRA
ncbi:hypothetical protein HK102_013697 [Quaeritorhiza haematococci]|nr:hypothetical protein HK102_013697 [Quaeritorhiza haematococci]